MPECHKVGFDSATQLTTFFEPFPIDETVNMVIRAMGEHQVQVARIDPADTGAGLTLGARIGDGVPARSAG
ncbi:hypothetical protein ACFPOI_08335 [Nonomuraea angiospora]|uniref:Uncharacterized protein n=1 Tax=Nonomuraea angiospora TaxID=46172 RepID=A0ABR9MDN7_9ACTN|nr:hypothetical protein [Nonomuraea angiospora]MBE1591036.1 hypothetical protein [Nonomuraea angiospora]